MDSKDRLESLDYGASKRLRELSTTIPAEALGTAWQPHNGERHL